MSSIHECEDIPDPGPAPDHSFQASTGPSHVASESPHNGPHSPRIPLTYSRLRASELPKVVEVVCVFRFSGFEHFAN